MNKVFKAIPFNAAWITHDKIDIRAIYRRPVRDARGRQVVKDGIPQWDLTGGLPVRRHQDWIRKGYEYVTLASGADVTREVADDLRAKGYNPRDFIMDEFEMSPWNPELYLATAGVVEQQAADALTEMVERFGSDAVLAIKRSENPLFTLPEHLEGIPAGGKVKAPKVAPVLRNQAGEVIAGDVEVPGPAPKPKAASKTSAAGRSAKKTTAAARAAAAAGPEPVQ